MARGMGRRRSMAVVAGLTAAAMLAACGGGADDDSEDTGDDGSSENGSDGGDSGDGGGAELPELEGYADLGGETLVVASDWSGAEQENFEIVLDAFEEATGAEVTYESYGNNVATTIGTRVEGGNPPNLALIPQPGLMDQLAADGNIVPLSEDTLAAVEENYAETWIDLGSVDGEVYGVWFKAANKSTIWYNTQVYEDAGAEVPETWEDFVSTLQLVSDSGVPGLSVGADVGWPLTDWFENVYLRTAGPEMYDQLADHEIPWTDPSVVEALETLAEVWSNDALLLEGGGQRSFPDSVTSVFSDPPEAGTVFEGDFVAGNIADQTEAVVGEDALFYPWPTMNDSAPSVMGAGNVAVAFDENEATSELMRYLASPEAANIWIELGGFTSPNQNADLDLYPDEISLEIAQNLVDAEVFRFDLSDLAPSAFGGTEGEGMWQILIEFYTDPSDPEATAQALEDAAAAAYGG
ncbi:ABC transporter substrate-binding protein [Georgenia sp. Z1491]|uniref:ABC transporter substrate-binding protein n=1 Tax=Georgenia sp. Z1491 TaxID=3416707 RepID=UPI003CF03D72